MKKVSQSIFLLCSLSLSLLLSSCGTAQAENSEKMLGDQAANYALELANSHPFRKIGSQGARDMEEDLVARLEKMGYQPERQKVSGTQECDNLIVHIKGKGFVSTEESVQDIAGKKNPDLPVGKFRKQVVLSACYTTPLGEADAAQAPDYDGISDNASGVAALLRLAEVLKEKTIGFDVDLLFLGDTGKTYAEVQTYFNQMSEDAKKNLDVFITLESLYAGEKLYANAGPASAKFENRQKLREPLYRLLDISVSNYTGIRLLDNQSGLPYKLPDGQKTVYREFTVNPGDAQVFDQAGYPVVIIESADYEVDQIGALVDSKNSKFETTQGRVRGTAFDSYLQLKEVLPEDQLKTRLNAVVYWLEKYLENGLYYAEIQ